MRIGFDAKKAAYNFTGIGNYSRGAINALCAYYPSEEYLLFFAGEGNEEALRRLDNCRGIRYCNKSGYGNHIRKEYWRCRGIIKDLQRSGTDIYHGLSNELPFGIASSGIKSVVTIHDLIFLRMPETYDCTSRKILSVKVKYACKHADRIIAISKITKRDIMEYYGVPEKKIDVVYQGCDPIFSRPIDVKTIDAVKEKYGLPEKYILSVGTVEKRKNHISLINMAAHAENGPEIPVVIAGKYTEYQKHLEKMINEYGLQNKVRIINGIPNYDLPALYRGASVFVYPSVYEGFGIPVLEALNAEVPVIAASGSCLEETGGKNSLYFRPDDHEELGSLINRILHEPGLADTMRKSGKEYAARFNGQKIANDLMEVYKKLI